MIALFAVCAVVCTLVWIVVALTLATFVGRMISLADLHSSFMMSERRARQRA